MNGEGKDVIIIGVMKLSKSLIVVAEFAFPRPVTKSSRIPREIIGSDRRALILMTGKRHSTRSPCVSARAKRFTKTGSRPVALGKIVNESRCSTRWKPTILALSFTDAGSLCDVKREWDSTTNRVILSSLRRVSGENIGLAFPNGIKLRCGFFVSIFGGSLGDFSLFPSFFSPFFWSLLSDVDTRAF